MLSYTEERELAEIARLRDTHVRARDRYFLSTIVGVLLFTIVVGSVLGLGMSGAVVDWVSWASFGLMGLAGILITMGGVYGYMWHSAAIRRLT